MPKSFSSQKGSQRQRSLKSFQTAMALCGNDLSGLLKTRFGKALKTKLDQTTTTPEAIASKLLQEVGKVHQFAKRKTKQQWLALVKSAGYKRRDLLERNWKVSPAAWSRVCPDTPLPFPTTDTSSTPLKPSSSNKKMKENKVPTLLPFLEQFFDNLSFPCPHSNQRTMSFSENRLFKVYSSLKEIPCTLSRTCFRRIWKTYFKKNFTKPQHRDGLCQLCEIGHKIEMLEQRQNVFSQKEKDDLEKKKKIVQRHKEINDASKKKFANEISNLTTTSAVLVIDFKQNISLGDGPRELGQSWYIRERRTIFGMALYRKVAGEIQRYHFNLVSTCLTHDAIFVKAVLQDLFAYPEWKSYGIQNLSIWCDNAPHFRNKFLLAFLSELISTKTFKTVNLCFFEPYHGKSAVDSMFGTITQWLKEWKKTNFINTTEDLFLCFTLNNSNPFQNIFYYLEFSPDLWTKKLMSKLSTGPTKGYSFFKFSHAHPASFFVAKLALGKDKKTQETGMFEFSQQRNINLEEVGSKVIPKFSKTLEAQNSSKLTSADDELLQKKGESWGMEICW